MINISIVILVKLQRQDPKVTLAVVSPHPAPHATTPPSLPLQHPHPFPTHLASPSHLHPFPPSSSPVICPTVLSGETTTSSPPSMIGRELSLLRLSYFTYTVWLAGRSGLNFQPRQLRRP
ncbi:hypothetical protein E2C01_091158 [Portunus trituberculatus]|uniref:Uncharacterized protein n=1 Tax=Portunus trituberculatus TaxID=210409 RepID=A0A5B7JM91_PORTR|nr:hypothetical protein [Portunus trituberculatus]